MLRLERYIHNSSAQIVESIMKPFNLSIASHKPNPIGHGGNKNTYRGAFTSAAPYTHPYCASKRSQGRTDLREGKGPLKGWGRPSETPKHLKACPQRRPRNAAKDPYYEISRHSIPAQQMLPIYTCASYAFCF